VQQAAAGRLQRADAAARQLRALPPEPPGRDRARGAGQETRRGHDGRAPRALGHRAAGAGWTGPPRRLRAAARRRDDGRRHALRAPGRRGGGLGHRGSRDPRAEPHVRLRAGHLGSRGSRRAREGRRWMELTAMRVLVIDVGGSNVKVLATGQKEPVRIPSGPDMSAAEMAGAVKKAVAGWKYDAVSIGYPGPVINNKPAAEPANLGGGWGRFEQRKALRKPVPTLH